MAQQQVWTQRGIKGAWESLRRHGAEPRHRPGISKCTKHGGQRSLCFRHFLTPRNKWCVRGRTASAALAHQDVFSFHVCFLLTASSLLPPLQVSSGSAAGSSVAGSSRQQPRQRITRVNLRDLIFCMEHDRPTARSLILYKALLK